MNTGKICEYCQQEIHSSSILHVARRQDASQHGKYAFLYSRLNQGPLGELGSHMLACNLAHAVHLCQGDRELLAILLDTGKQINDPEAILEIFDCDGVINNQ